MTFSSFSPQSPNIKTEPQKKIHKLTNTFPNDPRSPFYGPDPLKPVARIQLTRTDVAEKLESCSSEKYIDIREVENTHRKGGNNYPFLILVVQNCRSAVNHL